VFCNEFSEISVESDLFGWKRFFFENRRAGEIFPGNISGHPVIIETDYLRSIFWQLFFNFGFVGWRPGGPAKSLPQICFWYLKEVCSFKKSCSF